MTDRKANRTEEERMMKLTRELSMKKFENLYAEPPQYSARPPSVQKVGSNGAAGSLPASRVPDVKELNFTTSPLEIPTPAECIAHLKLLHAFAKLRHDVGNHEGIFGICAKSFDGKDQIVGEQAWASGEQQPGGVHEQDAARAAADAHAPQASADIHPEFAERIRDKRWAVFVTKAVARFEDWWMKLRNDASAWQCAIKTTDFDATELGVYDVARFPLQGDGYEMDPDFHLPPLDVLMVWHTYMLNPRIYLEDCVRYSKQTLWRTKFPWERVYRSIDDETFEYAPGNDVANLNFLQTTGHHWDPLRDEELRTIACPRCACINKAPWTNPPTQAGPHAFEDYLVNDTGFSGQAFHHPCSSCSFTITHEKLRVGKFIIDAYNVTDKKRPLAGTILNMWGTPAGTTIGKKLTTHDAFFPHRCIEFCSDFQVRQLRAEIGTLTVEAIKAKFEWVMRSPRTLDIVNSGQRVPGFLAKGSKITVRKVLSHYWDNSSHFGIDLIGAVLRQASFVQKMRKLDWLHSPSVMATTQRLIVKYHRFVRLAAENPSQTVVPTLDVDLAWHTHQLTPQIYYRYTLSEMKKLLNHDDKIPETNLHTSFQWTSQAYEKKYGQPYSECSCWYCECTREPLRSNFLSKLSPRRSSLAVDKLDEKGFTKSPHDGPHVSAHNAFIFTDERSARLKRRDLEELDLQYAKVCKRYQKQKNAKTPRKDDDDAHIYGAYGYPMYYPMPVYMPYYADTGCPESHANAGGAGNCAAGTCAVEVSFGACAGGVGTPGCAASCGGGGTADGGCGSCSGGDGGGGGCGGGGD